MGAESILQDTYDDATKIGSQTGSEVSGGCLMNINLDEGTCLTFDGVDDYVQIADTNDWSFGNGTSDTAFTMMAWCYMVDATNFYIISKDNFPTSTAREYRFIVNSSDQLDLTMIDQSASATIGRSYSTALTNYQNQWCHLACTYSGSSAASGVKLFLNGIRVDTTNITSGTYVAMENLGTPVQIGARSTSSTFSNGKIDDVRMWRSELTEDEVWRAFSTGANPSTPVSWYKFNDGSGTTAVDSGSGGYDGDLTGHAPTWTTDHAPFYALISETNSTDLLSGQGSTAVTNVKYTLCEKPGGSLGRIQFSGDNSTWKNSNNDDVSNSHGYFFDGVNDVITVAQSVATLMSASTGTMACWFRPMSAGPSEANPFNTDGIITDSGGFLGINWGTFNSVTGFHFWNYDGTADTVSVHVPTSMWGQWFHLVWKHASGTLTAYVNGVAVGSVASGNTSTTTGTIRIGANWTGGAGNDFTHCFMDDVRIYNVGLTDAEVWDLYSLHKENHTSSTERKLWLKLDNSVTDSSGNGYDGSASGAAAVSDFFLLPQFGDALIEDVDTLSFDGVNDVVTVNDGDISAALNGAAKVTYGAWFQSNNFPTATTQGLLFVILGNSAQAGLILTLASSTITYGGRSVTSDSAQTTTYSFNFTRDWHYLVAVNDYTNDEIKLYIDGILVKTTSVSFGNTTYTDDNSQTIPDHIGATHSGAATQQYYNGRLSNVTVWKDERSVSEIRTDFLRGYVDTSDANMVFHAPLHNGSGNPTDVKGSISMTNSGANWIKTLHRPQQAAPSQQTINISALSLTSALYVRQYYTHHRTHSTIGLDEMTIDFTAGANEVRYRTLLGVGT